MSARKARAGQKALNGYASPVLQRQWDKAAALIDEASDLINDTPRATLGHPASMAQFNDLIPDLKAAVNGLRAIHRWEMKRYDQMPEPVREALSSLEVLS